MSDSVKRPAALADILEEMLDILETAAEAGDYADEVLLYRINVLRSRIASSFPMHDDEDS